MAFTSKTKKDLKNEYNVSWVTLRKWLLRVPDLNLTKQKQFFTPLEMQQIYAHLGKP